MPHSHHSHSGQFCNHAVGSLASMLETAHAAGMTSFGLTEHCPRSNSHLYPGELAANHDQVYQTQLYDSFILEAVRLRDHYASSPLKILIGFEAEWIRPDESTAIARDLLQRHKDVLDYFIGSVHFVAETPIDYDRAMYVEARVKCGGEEQGLFARYFDDQYEMLEELRPKVVGHFDLVRLWSDEPDRGWGGEGVVWGKIMRNLEFVKGYGGFLEINTSAWRKGMKEPYPRKEIARAWNEMGGLCVLSDDSHAVGHVGTNYTRLFEYFEGAGIERIAYLERGIAGVEARVMSLLDLRRHPYWKSVKAE